MLSLIVAVDKNFGIGKDNKMPWHYKEDLLYFKKITLLYILSVTMSSNS